MSLKIIHVSPTYAPVMGGAEQHMKALSEGLVSRGHDVTVLTANVRNTSDLFRGVYGALAETEVINGVQVVRFHPSGGMVGAGVRRWLDFPGGWRSLKAVFGEGGMEMWGTQPQMLGLVPYLLFHHADIVMAMNWHWAPAYYTHLVQQFRRFVIVGVPQFHTEEQWCQRPIYREMLASSSAIVANTAYEEQFARTRGAHRVEIGGVGVYPESFAFRNGAAIKARYGIGNEPVVGFVGRQEVNKGVVQLIRAMKIVWRWNPDVRLIIAGHHSAEHQGSAAQSVLEELTDRERQRLVRINKFEETDKPSLYDALDVFVLPSIGESFGLAYLEAWLCKKPVIGARIGATQCVIDDGVDGFLADPKSVEDLAGKIIALLSDREKREKMGMAGYSKTLARYTWDKVIDRVETLYRDLHAAKDSTDARSVVYRDASRGSQV